MQEQVKEHRRSTKKSNQERNSDVNVPFSVFDRFKKDVLINTINIHLYFVMLTIGVPSYYVQVSFNMSFPIFYSEIWLIRC